MSTIDANEVLDMYATIRDHAATCRQCRLSPEYCEIRARYQENFEVDFKRWLRERRATPELVEAGR